MRQMLFPLAGHGAGMGKKSRDTEEGTSGAHIRECEGVGFCKVHVFTVCSTEQGKEGLVPYWAGQLGASLPSSGSSLRQMHK